MAPEKAACSLLKPAITPHPFLPLLHHSPPFPTLPYPSLLLSTLPTPPHYSTALAAAVQKPAQLTLTLTEKPPLPL